MKFATSEMIPPCLTVRRNAPSYVDSDIIPYLALCTFPCLTVPCIASRVTQIYELGTPAPSPIVPTAPPSITSSTPPTPTPIVDGTLPPTLTPAVGATLPPTPMPVVGATTPPTPAPQPVDSGSYLGCYTDVKSARIMTQKSTSSVMTLEVTVTLSRVHDKGKWRCSRGLCRGVLMLSGWYPCQG